MSNYYGGSGSFYTPKQKKSSGGSLLRKAAGVPAGFVGNLVSDVKDAVIGLPTGIIQLAKDPVKGVQDIGAAMWTTWSPLFRGDLGKFVHQTYDHPLAPILDVLTVFTLGAGSAARGAGALSKVGVGGSRVEKVARLRTPKRIDVPDPTGQRHVLHLDLSTRAGRRIIQEARLSLEPHLPQLFANTARRARYERLFRTDMAHRQVAKSVIIAQALWSGRMVSDESLAPRIRSEIVAGQYINLARHNKKYTPEEAAKLVKSGHYGYLIDAALIDRTYGRRVTKLRRQEAKWEKQWAANVELAGALPKIEKELADANRQLERMYAQGARIATPASQTKRLTDLKAHITDLEAQLLKAQQAKSLHDEALSNLDTVRLQRMKLEKRSFKEYFAAAGHSPEAFENMAKNLGRWALTRDISRAARTRDGKVYVIPFHDAKMLGLEAANSHKFVQYIWHKPTTLWKLLIVGYTPRIFTNNFIGNWIIHALREGPSPEAAQAVFDAIRFTRGEWDAVSSFKAAVPFKQDHWLYRYFADEMGDVFGRDILYAASTAKTRLGRIARGGLYPFVHRYADQPVRVAAIYTYLRRSPEVQKIMREQGLDFNRAVTQALRKNRTLRDATAVHARRTAGDYATLLGFERPIRDIVPFYLWYRHILRTGWNTTLDTPGRLTVLSRISNQGITSVEELLGEVPEFLEGVVPLSILGLDDPDDSRQDVLLTQSLNPFASIGELTDLFRGLTVGGGERGLGDAVTGVNPFLTATIEAVSGRSILTGAPKDTTGGLFSTILTGTVKGLPHVRLVKALTSEDTTINERGNPYMFARDDRGQITSLFGIPVRNMDVRTANAIARFRQSREVP